jgi:hypothetical protein
VEGVVERLRAFGLASVQELEGVRESTVFALPEAVQAGTPRRP